MGWIIYNPATAEAAGVSLEMDDIIFAIAVGDVANVFDVYKNHQLGLEETDPVVSHWDQLPGDHRRAYREAVDAWIDRHLADWDEGIQGVFEEVRGRIEG